MDAADAAADAVAGPSLPPRRRAPHDAPPEVLHSPAGGADDLHVGDELAMVLATELGAAGRMTIEAIAGADKSTALREYARRHPSLRFLYLGFNAVVQAEKKAEFAACAVNNVEVLTLHGLAFRHTDELHGGNGSAIADSLALTPQLLERVCRGTPVASCTAAGLRGRHLSRLASPSHPSLARQVCLRVGGVDWVLCFVFSFSDGSRAVVYPCTHAVVPPCVRVFPDGVQGVCERCGERREGSSRALPWQAALLARLAPLALQRRDPHPGPLSRAAPRDRIALCQPAQTASG